MKISEVMSTEVETVAAEATIQAAAQSMAELDVVALPVQDRDALVGIITERDITIRVVAAGLVPAATSVVAIMSGEVFSCRPDDDADAIVAAMRERSLHQAPVVDESGKVIGLVTLARLRRGEEAAATTEEAQAQ